MLNSRKIVADKFAEIIDDPAKLWYARDKYKGKQEICPYAQSEERYPRGAGDAGYISAATAFRLTGDDQGLAVDHPMDVPQDLITANRLAFIEGLLIAAPDETMRKYLSEKLAEEKFLPSGRMTSEQIYKNIVNDFPRVMTQDARNGSPRRVSLEHDVRRAFDNDESAGGLFKPRHDRKNLSQADLLRTYQTFQKHPELYLALQLWQSHVKSYFQEMEGQITNHFVPAHEMAMSDFGPNPQKMTETFPLHHAVHFSANSVDLPQQLIFFGAAATAQAELHHQGTLNGAMPSCEDMSEGFYKMQPAGFFRRAYESQWGERKIMCPFGATAVRWLTLDLGEEGAAQDCAIAKCVAAVTAALSENEDLQNMADAVQRAMTVIMSESDPQIKEQPRNGGKSGCPYAH